MLITGSNTSLTQAFLLALQRTLAENELLDIMPTTNYQAAVQVIERWKVEYKDTFQHFKGRIREPIADFIQKLNIYDIKAYETFERIYPELTAGSIFNPFWDLMWYSCTESCPCFESARLHRYICSL